MQMCSYLKDQLDLIGRQRKPRLQGWWRQCTVRVLEWSGGTFGCCHAVRRVLWKVGCEPTCCFRVRWNQPGLVLFLLLGIITQQETLCSNVKATEWGATKMNQVHSDCRPSACWWKPTHRPRTFRSWSRCRPWIVSSISTGCCLIISSKLLQLRHSPRQLIFLFKTDVLWPSTANAINNYLIIRSAFASSQC